MGVCRSVIIALVTICFVASGCKKQQPPQDSPAKPSEEAPTAKPEGSRVPDRATDSDRAARADRANRQAEDRRRREARPTSRPGAESEAVQRTGTKLPPVSSLPDDPPPQLEVGQVGTWEQKYADGKPRVIREVKKNEAGELVNHGLYTSFHPNGQKAREAHFVDGKLHGKVTNWDESGNVTSEEEYAGGTKVK